MSNLDPLFFALFGIVAGGSYFLRGLRLWREKRGIQDLPLSKISGVAIGDVEVTGKVEKAEQLVKTPFSGRSCVYYSYEVEALGGNGWNLVEKGRSHSIFYIDDGTGRILINPQGATFEGTATYQQECTRRTFRTPGIASWIAARERRSPLASFTVSGLHRFTEYTVKPRQVLFAEGAVSLTRHVVAGIEREELILGKRNSGDFVLSAHSEDQLLSELSWKILL